MTQMRSVVDRTMSNPMVFAAVSWTIAWQLVAQPSPSMASAGLGVIGTLLSVVSIGLILVLRGRTVTDEEVRPVYAKNIIERLTLRAELSMGREARQRMLPTTAPTIPNGRLEFSPAHDDVTLVVLRVLEESDQCQGQK